MAVRNAVLSQSPEFKEQRLKAFETACNAYNLLIVCLARWGQIKLFHEVDIKFAYSLYTIKPINLLFSVWNVVLSSFRLKSRTLGTSTRCRLFPWETTSTRSASWKSITS